MKKFLIIALILLPFILMAQTTDNGEETEQSQGFGMGGAVGSITIGDKTYSQIRLMPEINVWRFGFGLDVDLLIDSEGNLRKEDWDETKDIINKIYYIRFNQRKDIFYFKVGSIPDYTLGHGLIFDGYSNMLQYPNVRNIGGYVGINTPYLGLGTEVFTSNVEKNQILAGRVHATPLSILDIPIISKLRVGINVGVDRNQFGKFPDKDGDKVPDIFDAFPDNSLYSVDTDGDGFADQADIDADGDNVVDSTSFVIDQYPWMQGHNYLDQILNLKPEKKLDKEDEVYVYSADYELPLIESDSFGLTHYAEVAQIKDYGTGFIFPGFGMKFFVFDANLEFRRFGDKFLPGYFDHLYDEQRSFVQNDASGEPQIVTKEATLENVKASLGWYGSVKANIANAVFLKAAYQDMYGEDVQFGKSIWATLGLDPTVVPKLKEASISYAQLNVPYLAIDKLQTPSATIDGKVSYGLSDNTNLVGKYSERYVDLDGNGEIKGKDETIKSLSFGVEFKF